MGPTQPHDGSPQPDDDRPLLQVRRGRYARRDAAEPSDLPPKRGWATVFRVLTILLGLVLGLGAFGWPSLVAPWFATGSQVIHRVHNLGYGALVGILLAAPLVAQARRPEARPAAMQQAIVAGVTMVVAEAVSTDLEPFFPSVLILVLVVASLHPARGRLLRRPARPSPATMVLAVAGAIPLIWFAVHESAFQRNGSPLDPHVQMHHWTTMTGLGLAIAAVAILASFRTDGWRIPAWCAGLAAAVYGAASLAYPSYAGASGRAWGSVAVLGGLAFIAVAEVEGRLRPGAG